MSTIKSKADTSYVVPSTSLIPVIDSTGSILKSVNPSQLAAASSSSEPSVTNDKASAVLLTPTTGQALYILSADGRGNLWRGVSGGSGYSDDGGSFCGTVFIPTGGDGTTAWVRDYNGNYNPAWYGVTPDSSDNSAEIITALTEHNYIHFSLNETYLIEGRISVALTGNISVTGNNTTIKVGSGASSALKTAGMINIEVTGNTGIANIFTDGITWDGDDLAQYGLRVVNKDVTTAEADKYNVVSGNNSMYKNFQEPVGGGACAGLQVSGWFRRVTVKSSFKDLTSVDATPGGTRAITVDAQNGTTIGSYTNILDVDGANIDDVSSDVTGVNSDGIYMAGPDSGSDTDQQMLIVRGTYIKNCHGRSIKSQVRHNVVTGNFIYRDKYSNGAGDPEIDFQRGGGTATGNEFHYDGEEAAILVNSTVRDGNESSFICSDNKVIIENITTPNLIQMFESVVTSGTDASLVRIVVKDNIVRGNMKRFGKVSVDGATTQNEITVDSNKIEGLEGDDFVYITRTPSGDAHIKAHLENNWSDAAITHILNISVSGVKLCAYLRNNHNMSVNILNLELPPTNTILQWEDGDYLPNPSLSVDAKDMILTGWSNTAPGKPGAWFPNYVSTVSPTTP